MASTPQIHWHEGLFLQPHHLQALQRSGEARAADERRLATPFPYGVVSSRLATDALENAQVRFERLRVIMPDGLEVDFPGNADLPALDIKRTLQTTTQPFVVYLVAPNYDPNRANTLEAGNDDPRIKRLYRAVEGRLMDENTGDNAQPVLLRRINARLVTEFDDRSEMQAVPVARIKIGAGDQLGQPKRDEEFVPPCLGINGAERLRRLLMDLTDAVEAARTEMVNRLRGGGWAPENLRGPQIIGLMKLQAVNRAASRLRTLVTLEMPGGAGPTPLEMYLELRELLGSLAAASPDRDPFAAPKYDHDAPLEVFRELDHKVRSLLMTESATPVVKVAFKPGAEMTLERALAEGELDKATTILLGVASRKGDPKAIKKLLEDPLRFRLLPPSWRAMARVSGVKLEEERYPPPGLGTPTGQHYYRLVPADNSTSQRAFEAIKREKNMLIDYDTTEPFDREELAIFMTMP